MPRWASTTLERTECDMNPPGGSDVATPAFDRRSLLGIFDDNVKAASDVLARTSDGDFMVQWTLKNGGRSVFSMPRVECSGRSS